MKSTIEEILKQTFKIHSLKISDDSALHAGHQGAKESGGGHFTVSIISNDFKGKTLVQRHRAVYAALHHYMGRNVHALALTTLTPEEIP